MDEQDAPPVFTLAPPTTNLNRSLKPGDLVLKVRAEDGDRGNPRDIRYGLVSEGNPFTPFFNLSEDSGEVSTCSAPDFRARSERYAQFPVASIRFYLNYIVYFARKGSGYRQFGANRF